MNAMRFVRRAAALGLATALLAACGNPTGDDHDEPDLAGVVITVGGTSVEIGPTGQTGTLSLATGQSHQVTVRAVNAAGADDPAIVEHAEDYEIRITQDGVSRFNATGTGYPFAGTITTGATTGQAVYRVAVYSTEHGHEEGFGFLTLTVTASTVN
jgi:ABC-type glycerol-3-phosphate transport system substrate-binding protein